MARALGATLLLALAAMPGCTCGAKSAPALADPDAGTTASPPASGATASPSTPALLSAPIAAARGVGGAVFVAGLVVPDKTIVVTRLEASGATSFTVPVLRGVSWSSDADLRMYPTDGGAIVVWRGPRDGKAVRQMVVVGKGGELAGDPVDVGPASCATEAEIVWNERGKGDRARVVARGWTGGAAREVATIGGEREPVLVCGARRVFALGQGEDDVTLAAAAPGAEKMVISASDFGGDDERELAEYTVGDDLGILRVGSAGQLALRETKGDELGAWRKLAATIPGDDDLVAVDGDARAAVIVTTHEIDGACGDGSSAAASRVLALRVDRTTYVESSVELAPTECGKELGPFWTGSAGGRFVVAWVERVAKRDGTSAPIAGLAYRAMDGATLAPIVHVARPSDSLVDAGCDKDRCYAVALVRAPGTTNMVPEVVQTIAYP